MSPWERFKVCFNTTMWIIGLLVAGGWILGTFGIGNFYFYYGAEQVLCLPVH